MGYGTENKIYLKGGVLENRPLFHSEETDKNRKNFRVMLSRYLSSPIPDKKVTIIIGNEEFHACTDEYGYFSKWVSPKQHFKPGWHQAYFCIHNENGEQVKKTAEFLIVGDSATFGVISDIDDTVLVSHATQLFRKLRLILTKNAKTRLPFTGVAEFYKRLKGEKDNPFFYVSSSEWNLYDFLLDFFTFHHIPKGPFLLQEFKSGLKDLLFTGGGSHQHKQEKIKRLMHLFPHLNFVLIGDSGQRDTEIYQKALQLYPERILAVYIRKIGKKDEFDKMTIEEFQKEEVSLLMVKDSKEALLHAEKMGLVSKA